jgi:hypothetical protein
MRPLKDVINAAINIIPDECGNVKSGFTYEAQKLKDSLDYTAPEAVSLRWQQFIHLLEDFHLGSEPDWQNTLRDMVAGKIDYKNFL